jgi:hypothetical protein
MHPLHALLILLSTAALTSCNLSAMALHNSKPSIARKIGHKKREKIVYTPSSRAKQEFDFPAKSPACAPSSSPHSRFEEENLHASAQSEGLKEDSASDTPKLPETIFDPMHEAIEREAALMTEEIKKTLELYMQKENALLAARMAGQISSHEWLAATHANIQERNVELMRIQKKFQEQSCQLHNKQCEEVYESVLNLVECHV